MSDIVTVIAPVNIAVIKYWGKRDEELILPLNDSVSATLDTSIMCARTSVCARPEIAENEIWLNGAKTSFNNPRLQNCLKEIKYLAASQKRVSNEFLSWNIRICSENNFPTAAGLASSAAGYACLVVALSKLYNVSKCDISTLARLGSGSASRSVYGGFVKWQAGNKCDGSDSVAIQVADSKHWPEMRVLILVVANNKKCISSQAGMKCTVETSELLKQRVKYCVPKRVAAICEAILARDFPTFAEITMKDSNSMHAVCLDSYPPFVYMTDVSHKIVRMVHCYNEMKGIPKVAYTYDAGPNATLYLLEEDVAEVITLVKHIFPSSNKDFITGLPAQHVTDDSFLKTFPMEPLGEDSIMQVIFTKVGEGPQIVQDGLHLLDENACPMRLQ